MILLLSPKKTVEYLISLLLHGVFGEVGWQRWSIVNCTVVYFHVT